MTYYVALAFTRSADGGIVACAAGHHKAIEGACEVVAARDLQALRDLKRDRFGPHPSQLPGWKPLWKRQREAAAAAK